MAMGLGVLFAVRIYTCSQSLLLRSLDPSLGLMDCGALLLGCLLMVLGADWPANNIAVLDEAEIAAVGRIVAIVAHHEVAVRRHYHFDVDDPACPLPARAAGSSARSENCRGTSLTRCSCVARRAQSLLRRRDTTACLRSLAGLPGGRQPGARISCFDREATGKRQCRRGERAPPGRC